MIQELGSFQDSYVQGVTNFGTACVGLKIDGALHAGGNDSIVANDFTQIQVMVLVLG